MSDGTIYVNFKSQTDYATVIFGDGVFIPEIIDYCKYVDWFIWDERKQYRIKGDGKIKLVRLIAFVQRIRKHYNYDVMIRNNRNQEWKSLEDAHLYTGYLTDEEVFEVECQFVNKNKYYKERQERIERLKENISQEEWFVNYFKNEKHDIDKAKTRADLLNEYKTELDKLISEIDISDRIKAIKNIFAN